MSLPLEIMDRVHTLHAHVANAITDWQQIIYFSGGCDYDHKHVASEHYKDWRTDLASIRLANKHLSACATRYYFQGCALSSKLMPDFLSSLQKLHNLAYSKHAKQLRALGLDLGLVDLYTAGKSSLLLQCLPKFELLDRLAIYEPAWP